MAHAFTSNSVTRSHGPSPMTRKTNANFRRGFVIYIGWAVDNDGFTFQPSIFWSDLGTEGKPANQLEFENAVVAAKGQPTKGPTEGDLTPEWPARYSTDISNINFGWEPCHVTYILASKSMHFVDDPDPFSPSDHNQPVVFRSEKIIVGYDGASSFESFERNESFFNLTVDNSDSCYSKIRMQNFMLDDRGNSIGRPPAHGNRPTWNYCMDMHVRIGLKSAKMDLGAGPKLADGSDGQPYKSISEWLTIVFDPPQTNGGGGPPPP